MEHDLLIHDYRQIMDELNVSGVVASPNFTSEESALGPPVGDKPVRTWQEYVVADRLLRYVLLTIILLGTLGNVLSVAVLARKRMRYNSVNFYLMLLACADSLVLYLSGFKTWLRVVTGFELLHVSNAGCKIVIFLFMFASHVSAWLIVLVTADRFIAVWFPFRATILCSLRRSRITGATLLGIMAAYNAHLLWTNHLFESSPGTKQCAPLPSNSFMKGPFIFIRLALYTIVPFLLVFVMNVAIIVCICRHSKRRVSEPHVSRLVTSGRADCRLHKNKHQVTVMLLIVSFAWLMLTMPYTAIVLVDFSYPDNRSRAATFLLKTACFLLMYLNHSVNFILYCIAGRKFRTELRNMFQELQATITRRGRSSGFSLNDRTGKTPRQLSPPSPAARLKTLH